MSRTERAMALDDAEFALKLLNEVQRTGDPVLHAQAQRLLDGAERVLGKATNYLPESIRRLYDSAEHLHAIGRDCSGAWEQIAAHLDVELERRAKAAAASYAPARATVWRRW